MPTEPRVSADEREAEIVVEYLKSGISRREALKTTAKAAGAAAFLAPVVVGVFNSSASAAACNGSTDSDAVQETVIAQNISWNSNCGGAAGNYNAQNKNVTLLGGTGSIQLGEDGTDNIDRDVAFYVITPPVVNGVTYECNAVFAIPTCPPGDIDETSFVPTTNRGPVLWCSTDCSNQPLLLTAVVCCPV